MDNFAGSQGLLAVWSGMAALAPLGNGGGGAVVMEVAPEGTIRRMLVVLQRVLVVLVGMAKAREARGILKIERDEREYDEHEREPATTRRANGPVRSVGRRRREQLLVLCRHEDLAGVHGEWEKVTINPCG